MRFIGKCRGLVAVSGRLICGEAAWKAMGASASRWSDFAATASASDCAGSGCANDAAGTSAYSLTRNSALTPSVIVSCDTSPPASSGCAALLKMTARSSRSSATAKSGTTVLLPARNATLTGLRAVPRTSDASSERKPAVYGESALELGSPL
jgi:hypothetical protein